MAFTVDPAWQSSSLQKAIHILFAHLPMCPYSPVSTGTTQVENQNTSQCGNKDTAKNQDWI